MTVTHVTSALQQGHNYPSTLTLPLTLRLILYKDIPIEHYLFNTITLQNYCSSRQLFLFNTRLIKTTYSKRPPVLLVKTIFFYAYSSILLHITLGVHVLL